MTDKQTLSEKDKPVEEAAEVAAEQRASGSEKDKPVEEAAEVAAEQTASGSEPATVETLQLALEDAQNRADQHYNELLRARADLENGRKRAQRDVENAHKFGLEKLLHELLPVKDSVELGLSAAEKSDDSTSLQEGMELTLQMLTTGFEKLGVRELNPVGEKFDPNYHQAMTTQPSQEAEAGCVLSVVQRGYVLNDRLLRPALVIVAAADSGPTNTGEDDEES